VQSQRTLKRDFGKKGKRDDTWTDYRSRNVNWENIYDKAASGSLNESFEEYYKEQGACPPEEWDKFIETLIKPLPIVFRINGSGKFADTLRSRLEDDFFSKFAKDKLKVDGNLPETAQRIEPHWHEPRSCYITSVLNVSDAMQGRSWNHRGQCPGTRTSSPGI
jgi:hypothetical protein